MTNKKLSSIEFLYMMLTPAKPNEQIKKILEKAKEKHREEIEEAYHDGKVNGLTSSEQYYEDNFNQDKK